MSNQSTELQKVEKKESEKSAFACLSESPAFEVGTKISTTTNALLSIMLVISGFILFLYSSGYFVLLAIATVLTVLLFVLSALSLYFVSLRPKIKRLTAENESLNETKEVPLLDNPEVKEIIENLNVEHLEQINLRQLEYQKLETEYKIKTKSLIDTQKELGREKLYNSGHQDTIKNKESDIKQLTEMLAKEREEQEPKIDFLWEKANSKFLKSWYENEGDSLMTHRVCIGIKNLTDKTITDVRVYIEYLNNEHHILLREKNDTIPYQKSYTLNPKAELLFYIGQCSAHRVFTIYHALSNTEPLEIPPYATSFNIVVEGSGVIPNKRQMSFMWKQEGLVSPGLLKP